MRGDFGKEEPEQEQVCLSPLGKQSLPKMALPITLYLLFLPKFFHCSGDQNTEHGLPALVVRSTPATSGMGI